MAKTAKQLKEERAAIAARRKLNREKLQDTKIREGKLEEKIEAQTKRIRVKTKEIRATKKPLRAKAFENAKELVGVMERGGNNTGPTVDKIIRANGGAIGEPWCGDFVAFVYKAAGSKTVDRSWASVNAIQSGNRGDFKRVSDPQQGDVVTYSFSHTGLFDKWIDRSKGLFATIEGNTGSSGARSDSLTGGDGVYAKNRSTSLGVAFWRVTG